MIRYYEQQGLSGGRRLANGYRDFPDETIDEVLRIRILIEAGLDIESLRPLLGCFANGHEPIACPALREQVRRTLTQLEEQERQLNRARQSLIGLLDTGIAATADTR